MMYAEETIEVENIFRCPICQGPVHKYEEYCKCEECQAKGFFEPTALEELIEEEK